MCIYKCHGYKWTEPHNLALLSAESFDITTKGSASFNYGSGIVNLYSVFQSLSLIWHRRLTYALILNQMSMTQSISFLRCGKYKEAQKAELSKQKTSSSLSDVDLNYGRSFSDCISLSEINRRGCRHHNHSLQHHWMRHITNPSLRVLALVWEEGF